MVVALVNGGSLVKRFVFILAAAFVFAALAMNVSAHSSHSSFGYHGGYGAAYNGYTYTPYTHYYPSSYSYGVNGWGAYNVHYHDTYRNKYSYNAYRYNHRYQYGGSYFYRPYYQSYYPYTSGYPYYW